MTIIATTDAPRRIYVAGARDEIDFADAVEALRLGGYIADLDAVYLPTGGAHADVEALCSSSLVVHVGTDP